MKQTVLVTGASSGFGLLIVNKLQASGYNVIGTSRNPGKNTGVVAIQDIGIRYC